MAQKTITELTLKSEVTEDLSIPSDDGIQTYRVTIPQMMRFFVPTGTILDYAGSSIPTGFLICGGQAVSRTTYSNLFALIGTDFGSGDGTTTFNLPDLRGRVAIGRDNMGGSSANRITTGAVSIDGATVGAAGGAQTHQLTTSEMPSHTHTQNAHNHTFQIFTGNFTSGNNATKTSSVSSESSYNTSSVTATNQNTGGDGAHNNVQPSIILNKIIRI